MRTSRAGWLCNSFLVLTGIFGAISAPAQTMTQDHTYIGKVRSVAIGFYGQTGVALQGASCRGSSIVFLLSSNPNYDKILALLFTAVSSGQTVKLARLEDNGGAVSLTRTALHTMHSGL